MRFFPSETFEPAASVKLKTLRITPTVRSFVAGLPYAFLVVVMAAGMLLTGCRGNEAFPNRPITLICPWSAGGGTDRVARQLASQLERELGVPVNVVNATGGGGVTGHTRGAQARPDGYTITMITAELNMLHWRGLTNITYEDFRPLVLANEDNAALFVRQDAPWSSLEELEGAVRKDPGELRASGTAFGGVWHISLAGWLLEAGLPADAVTWVSLNGSAPSLQELMAGGVDMVSCSVPEAASLLNAGEIRSLGVMAGQRLPGYPDIPTFPEQGIEWTSGTWRGLALPEGVPDDRFRVLADAAATVVNSQEYKSFLEQAGFGWANLHTKQFRAFLEEQDEGYGEILTSEAFRAVQSQQYGPMLFPYILIGLLLLTIGGLLWQDGLRLPEEAQQIGREGTLRVVLVAASVVAYMLVAEQIGYLLTAAAVLMMLFWWFRVRITVATAVILVLIPVTYQLFAVYLRVGLPWGWLGW